MNYKVILFYKFTPLADPLAIKVWQKSICQQAGVRGRIIVSEQGINGTVGGDIYRVKAYLRSLKDYPAFRDIDIKWSNADEEVFPRLSVKVRPELVTFGEEDLIQVDKEGVAGGGAHLHPKEVHKLVEEHGEDVVFFDGRNAYEADIGKFKDAIVPQAETTKDLLREIRSDKYNDLKDKHVVTYCTGGIRCEVLSTAMKKAGFENVYQIEGGIVRYGEQYGDQGLWEGALHVFDDRRKTTFSPEVTHIGSCAYCGSSTSDYHNCVDGQCRTQTLACSNCANRQPVACVKHQP